MYCPKRSEGREQDEMALRPPNQKSKPFQILTNTYDLLSSLPDHHTHAVSPDHRPHAVFAIQRLPWQGAPQVGRSRHQPTAPFEAEMGTQEEEDGGGTAAGR